MQIRKTFQESEPISNNFMNRYDLNGLNYDDSTFSPCGFVINKELPDFPAGIGEVQKYDATSLSEADHIFEYIPELDYASSICQIDIHINCILTFIDRNDDANWSLNGGITFNGIIKVSLCKSSISIHDALTNGLITSSNIINRNFRYDGGSHINDHEKGFFSYHGEQSFSRGEKLYLLFSLTSQGRMWGVSFFSGEYNSRISPFCSKEAFSVYPAGSGYMYCRTFKCLDQSFALSLQDSNKFRCFSMVNDTSTDTIVTVEGIPYSPGVGGRIWTLKQTGIGKIKFVAGPGIILYTPDGDTTQNNGALVLVTFAGGPGGNIWNIEIYPEGFKPSEQFTENADESYVRITLLSQVVAADPSKMYALNESMSRAAEIVTNDKVRVYSDYFGRTDALPYASARDGDGSLGCITNGLLIRNYSPVTAMQWNNYAAPTNVFTGASLTLTATPYLDSSYHGVIQFTSPAPVTFTLPTHSSEPLQIGTQILFQQAGEGRVTVTGETAFGYTVNITAPDNNFRSTPNTYMLLTKVAENEWLLASHAPMFASLKQLMSDLNAIHCVGMGMEPDTAPGRSGYDRLRVEPIRFFYNDSIIMTCENVDALTREVDYSSLVSIFNVGYQKWEAEGTNGLDEYNSTRQFRTNIKAVDTILDKVAHIVTSGYAVETTRRKFFVANTTDWRYDNDTFLICMKRNDDYSLSVETGDISHPNNIIDSTTAYNYRISPIRNALRWLWYALQSEISPFTARLKFNSGTGNYYARGKQATAPVESGDLLESTNLSLADYNLSTPPLYRPEFVKFKYPMNYRQWQDVFATKYGLIKYNVNDGDWQYGWIQDLKYDLYQGIAEFTLKPKI